MAQAGKMVCTALPPYPGAEPPLLVRQGAGRELCSASVPRLGEDGRS